MAGKTKTQRILDVAWADIETKGQTGEAERNEIALTIPALRQAVEDAKDGFGPVGQIQDLIHNGETVSPADLVHAEAMEKISKWTLGAKISRLTSLDRLRPVETATLANRAAAVLQQVMQGFEVLATRAPAKTWTFPEDATSIVVIAEPGIERDPYTGLVSGTVTVLFHRPGAYRPISVEAFEAAAKRERLSLTVQSNRIGDEGGWQVVGGSNPEPRDPNAFVIDTLTVRLNDVIDQHAVIPKVDLSSLPSRTWVEEVFRSNGSHPTGILGTDKAWHWGVDVGRHTVATGMRAEVASETIDASGIRTLRVTQKISTMNTHPSDFAAGLGEAIRLDRGLTYAGLGALTDSEVKAGSSNPEHQTANWTLTLVFESKAAQPVNTLTGSQSRSEGL